MVDRTSEWVAEYRRPIRRSTLSRAALASIVILALVAAGCSATEEPSTGDAASSNADEASAGQSTQSLIDAGATTTKLTPEEAEANALDRAVVITTTNCGDAGDSIGSGIALGGGQVLTAAHVIAGATGIDATRFDDYRQAQLQVEAEAEVDAEVGSDKATRATIIAFDPLRDLALLEIGSGWSSPVSDPAFAVATTNDSGTIIGGATSGDVDFTVTEKTIIEMDEVRGTRRSRRSGYLIDAETARGDSGAGLYDDAGHLVGVLFAVSTGDNRRSWATAGDELEEFLTDDSVTGTFACDPDQSKLVRQP